jgi:RHS repeat-associated protein
VLRRVLTCCLFVVFVAVFVESGSPAASSAGGLGLQRFYALYQHQLSDRMDLSVNLGNGNLVLHEHDLGIAGTAGQDEVLDRFYNSQSTQSTDLGYGWNLSAGRDVRLSVNTQTGDVTLFAPSGAQLVFTKNADGSYTSPTGVDATLAKPSSYTLTFHQSGEAWTFTNGGRTFSSDKDQNGNTIAYAYNADGTTKTVTDTQSRVTNFSYTNGLVTQITDPSSRLFKYAYTGSDLTGYTDPAGKLTSFGYDGSHNLTMITDPLGNVTKIAYSSDQVSSITYVTDPVAGTGPTVSFAYTSADASCPSGSSVKTTVTDSNNNQTAYCMDSTGRVVQVTDAAGHKTSTSYGPDSNVATFTRAGGGITTNSYDPTGENLTSSALPTGATGQLAYLDSAHPHYPTQMTDPQGNFFNYGYDSKGNVCAKSEGTVAGELNCTSPAGQNPLNFTHNSNGTIASAKDAKGNVTSYDYDSKGNLTTTTPPAPLGATVITYDPLSRPLTVTDGKNQKTTFTYDALDRITKLTYQDGSSVSYTYDADGNLTKQVDASGTTTDTYDPLNRPIKETQPGSIVLTYSWDGEGNLLSYSDPSGTVSYHYNTINQVDYLTEPNGNQTTFSYDPDGNRTSVAYPNGVTQHSSFDSSDRLIEIYVTPPGGGTRLTDLFYSYLTGANDTALRQSVTDQLANAKTTYHYDSADRLTEAKATSGGTLLSEYQYAYDQTGNRCAQNIGSPIGSFGCSSSGSGVTTYTYNNANELTGANSTTYSFDGNGNETGNSAGLSLAYNAKDQTTSITAPEQEQVNFSYRGAGQADRTSAGPLTFINSLLGVSSQTDSSGTAAFTRDPQGNLLEKRGPQGNAYYLFDGLGSVIGLTDANGNLIDGFTYKYSPYGEPLNTPPEGYPGNPWTYAGNSNAYYDHETGHYKIGQRYYDPATGRWTQTDLVSDPIDPHGWNQYDYTGDDPINHVDPSGMCWTGFCWASHALDWAAKHINEIDYAAAAAFCLEGAGLGFELGAETPLTAAGGAIAGCLINGLTETIIVHRAKKQIQQSG